MRLYEAYGQIVGSTAGDAFLLIGPTGAGKTAVLTVLKRAYGEDCCILPCEELMRAVVACCGAAGGPYPALHAYLDACAACRFVCVENADELTGREATTAMVRYCLQYWRRTAAVIVSAIRADGTALFGQETYHTLAIEGMPPRACAIQNAAGVPCGTVTVREGNPLVSALAGGGALTSKDYASFYAPLKNGDRLFVSGRDEEARRYYEQARQYAVVQGLPCAAAQRRLAALDRYARPTADGGVSREEYAFRLIEESV